MVDRSSSVSESDQSDSTVTRVRARGRQAVRRLLVVLALAFVPWTVIAGFDLTFVFPFGLVNDNPWSFVFVPDYLRYSRYGRAAAMDAWLVGAGVYVGAVVSAALGVTGWDDRRLTGGLLVVAGLSQFPLAQSFSRRPGTVAVPVGSVLLLVAAWWLYWPAFRAMVEERIE